MKWHLAGNCLPSVISHRFGKSSCQCNQFYFGGNINERPKENQLKDISVLSSNFEKESSSEKESSGKEEGSSKEGTPLWYST
jgi:hypothetical protein